MFGFGKNKDAPKLDESAPADKADAPREKPASGGLFSRLRDRLSRTRANLSDGLASVVLGRKSIDDDLMDDLETQLISADLGLDATDSLISGLTDRLRRKELADPEALYRALQEAMREMLEPVSKPLVIPESDTPFVILMVGVNGVGKTTTIGKLAKRLQNEGKKVMLAAGDTFRAAAVEQLQTWGERNDVPVIAQASGADAASVAYDAMESARARGVDVLIIDTAGRLHTQNNLMEELKKIKRVIGKVDPNAPHEVMLTVDAGTGQNALSQAREFNDAVGLSGINLSKLDGTAKGGVIFAMASNLGIPIRFIGVGESIDDLRPFDAGDFTNALFSDAGRSEP
ncbi:MAG: signal recognition particle-docking protein FtsY [Gammaproteobacteria bacterium]